MRTRTITTLSACFVLMVFSGSCRQTKTSTNADGSNDAQAASGGDRDRFGVLPKTINGFAVSRGAAAGYVDDRACKECHEELYQSYQSTGMARSFYPAEPSQIAPDLDKPYYHEASRRHYVMTQRGGKLVLKRYCLDEAGGRFAELESEVAWVMGSGNHGRTFLSQSERGELHMLPLAWYAEAGWRMAPGFDNPNHPRFERVVDRACMFCHNAYPELPVGADLPHKEHLFPAQLPHGIGCQRCHGPGARHIQSAADADASGQTIRERILNPANFTPQQREELCMTCHLQPEVALGEMMPRAFDKPVFSHQPGDPLRAFLTFLDHGSPEQKAERFQINHHSYRLRQSECRDAAGGKLTCLTCHDPHRKVPVSARPAYYRKKCLQCHQLTDCEEEEMGHGRDPAQSDCVSCHMFKARPSDVVHATVTDHLIRRRPAQRDLTAARREAPPEARVRSIHPYFQDQKGTPQARLYAGFGAAAGPDAGFATQWLEAFQATRPHPVAGYVNVGRGLLEAGEHARAIDHLRRAIDEFPDSPEAHWALGSAYLSTNDTGSAVTTLKRAAGLAPQHPGIAASLGAAFLGSGEMEAARAQHEAALRGQPRSWKTWQQYGYLLQQLGEMEPARRAYRRAIALNPDDIYSYRALGSVHEAAEDWPKMFAVLEQGAARSLDLEMHLIMCWLFAPDPRTQQPARALERARALSEELSDNPRAHLHHALALYRARADVTAAVEAAQKFGADPASCFGILILDGHRRNDSDAVRALLGQFEGARRAPMTEPLRRVIEGLVRSTLSPRKSK